nr:IS1380 family transposase [Actinomycetota bacterium]
MVDDAGPLGLDAVKAVFDDQKVVSDAGIVLLATLADRLGVEGLVERFVCLDRSRAGARNAGRKVMALLFSMVLGGDCIDDAQVLRSGRTTRLLGWMPAPSTLGTFLRAFTFGHVRQLERVLGECLTRAWAAGAGPGVERLVIDVDSFITEVYGRQKQGAGFGYTRVRGLHPILACRADTGEVLQVRLRKGSANTQRGILRFTDELIARIGRANAGGGTRLLRADNGFWNLKLFAKLEQAGWDYSIGIRMTKPIQGLVDQIPEQDWTTINDYPLPGEAQIAETLYGERRMIVRRVRALPNAQSELFPAWFHYPFATNRTDEISLVEREHRQHAVVELAIRDLKDQALAHFPSGDFSANSAWTVIAALAHNMMRWTTIVGLPGKTVRTARTLRRRLLTIPGRLTHHAGTWTLHLPA